MRSIHFAIGLFTLMVWSQSGLPAAQTAVVTEAQRTECEALLQTRNLTITYAGVATTTDRTTYCYVKGILPPAIQFHAQLPLPDAWNGRFLKWGDGGKDGDLDFADHRVAEGTPWPTATPVTTTAPSQARRSPTTIARRRSISATAPSI